MKKILILLVFLAALVATTSKSYAQKQTDLIFFWGEGCPHCENAKPFLKELEEKYPTLKVHSFETWKNPENAKKLEELAKAYNTQIRGVPAFIIGNSEPIVGYTPNMQDSFIEKIEACVENGCPNPLDKLNNEQTQNNNNNTETNTKSFNTPNKTVM